MCQVDQTATLPLVTPIEPEVDYLTPSTERPMPPMRDYQRICKQSLAELERHKAVFHKHIFEESITFLRRLYNADQGQPDLDELQKRRLNTAFEFDTALTSFRHIND